MIHIITPENDYLYRDEMDQAHRLRHKIFVEEMGWSNLTKQDGREVDQFDTKHAVHMIYKEQGEVLGYQRMLPSTRPHLLSEIMPELCEVERPVGAHIWEWTRFCVKRSRREQARAVCPITNLLLCAAVEWSLECGISALIIETTPAWLLRMVQLHFRPMPLGLPRTTHGQDVIAVTVSFDKRTLDRLSEMRGSRRRPVIETQERPAMLNA
ncbi:MAG: GNAT family N-acetyltransferase [Beijerinckiaceae bacterium]|nr:GNAT family N-acetyltransferase [Beijerinckiaceae bacterium]